SVGREFAGKVKQLITGSTGLDDAEWGVTLFARDTFQIKAIVYKMRFDAVSAEYADFGEFYIGIQLALDELFRRLQLCHRKISESRLFRDCRSNGWVTERSIVDAWKACVPKGTGGSNPPPSAMRVSHAGRSAFLHSRRSSTERSCRNLTTLRGGRTPRKFTPG